MTEIKAIEGGQKDALLRSANIKKRLFMVQKEFELSCQT
jgi:hypothetical protein